MNPSHIGIPGYVEACQKQDAIRDAAFLDAPLTLCGLPVRLMTARHLAILTHCGNGFVTAGEIKPEHIPQLLWVLSPKFECGNAKRMADVSIAISNLPFAKCVREIEAYLDDMFLDSPPSEGKPGESYNSWLASIVDLLAREYGWRQDEILNLPLPCVFQYVRIIRVRNGDDGPQFNRLTDKVKADFLKARAATN